MTQVVQFTQGVQWVAASQVLTSLHICCVIFNYHFLNIVTSAHSGCHMIYNQLFQLYDSLCQVFFSWDSVFVSGTDRFLASAF